MNALWLIPFLPFAGFFILAGLNGRISQRIVSFIGTSSVGFAFAASVWTAVQFHNASPHQDFFSVTLWTWVGADTLTCNFGLHLDPLSLLMMLVVTGVGFLIHLYSVEYMADDPGYTRFFAYMNLFVGFMLMLVLGDNLLLLYLGWEGVGLCSYLLIGFWYQDPANGEAARKAFIVTRIGDTALAIGLFIIFQNTGVLHIQDLLHRITTDWPTGSPIAVLTALLFLGGAVGKSAQIPLQTWLPDAMAGPTPVSALIHAATMVTAGVYLIARMNPLYSLAPDAQMTVAWVGAATLLIAGLSALTQTDIKKILAYSTISQIGYMFLALGVGAYDAAMMHFMTHAFFKALLFLGAGAIIISLHHEQNIFKMGGLRRKLPAVFWTFLIGGSALAGFPLITAGFFSKDYILYRTFESHLTGKYWLWIAGIIGALLTSIYIFRLIFIVFFGEEKTRLHLKPRWTIVLPLIILSVLSISGGWLEIPASLGGVHLFSRFLNPVFHTEDAIHQVDIRLELILQLTAGMVSVLGIFMSYLLFIERRKTVEVMTQAGLLKTVSRFLLTGCGFDWLYHTLLIKPFEDIANFNKNDWVDSIYSAVAGTVSFFHRVLSATQTGQIRWYVAWMALGTIVYLALMVLPW